MGKDIFTVQLKKPNFANRKQDQNAGTSNNTATNKNSNKNRRPAQKSKVDLSKVRSCCSSTGQFLRRVFNSINNFRKRLIWNRIRFCVLFLLIALFILQITCVASPSWLSFYDVHTQGLWRVCTQVRGGIECIRYRYLPGYFRTIQALMVISILIYVLAFVYFVFMMQKRTWPPFLLTICTSIAGILTLSSLAIFTDENLVAVSASKLTFGWGYIVGWLNLVICIATSVIILFDHKYL